MSNIQWTDTGLAGLDSATFDKGDVTITGVDVDHVQIIGDGAVRYWYDGSALADGVVEVNVVADAVADLAGNRNAATTATFTLDTQQPAGTLLAPTAGSTTNQDLGYVDIQWTDTGLAGLDPATFDKDDVTITGVEVDHVQIIGDGVVRYWYDGSALADGVVEVNVVADAVADLAGNRNAATTATFTLDTQQPTGALLAPTAGSVTSQDLGYVDIQWTDTGLAGLDPATFDKGDVTITGVDVDHVQIIGDGVVRYWHDGSALADGVVEVNVVADAVADLAGNRNAATTATFTLDTQQPTGTLLAPTAGSATNQDLGYVDIQWTDTGQAGLNPATFDKDDVAITGVDVDHVQIIGDGVVRYWYDGSALADGIVEVNVLADAVADLAGNRNAATTATFTLDTQQPTGTLLAPTAGSTTNQDLGYVEIQWSDAGPAGLDSATRSTKMTWQLRA